jgi:DNA recombination protein RmuC
LNDLLTHPATLLASGFAAGVVLTLVFRRSSGEEKVLQAQLDSRSQDLEQSREEASSLNRELRQLSGDLARVNEANRHLQEQVAEGRNHLTELLTKNRGEFAHLARTLLDEQSKSFSKISQEEVGRLLVPFRDRIHEFRDRVEKTHESQSERFAALRQELAHLRDLNQKISEDALELTRALRGDNQVQGAWGEMLLERILEQSGLRKGSEYFTQESHHTEIDGESRRVRPDVIVRLPGDRHVIIDSKVSLTAYTDHINSEHPGEAEEAAIRHRNSVRAHLKGLSLKNYQNTDHLQSLDFILLFIPIESAFNLALKNDTDLYDQAFQQNIVIVTPSTLLATLRVIENLWRQDRQNHNAQRIAEEAGKLFDKFVAFVEDLEKIDQTLNQARAAWQAAHNKLTSGRGNLVGRAEKLQELGARTSKNLPASFQPPDQPTP